MPRYDHTIIHEHAQELYDLADGMVWKAALSAGLTGAAIGWGISLAMRLANLSFVGPWVPVMVAAGVMAIRAAIAAEREAFRLRLEAQQALCQMMVERNTAQTARHLEEIVRRGGRVQVPVA
jgi:hypothetical protein